MPRSTHRRRFLELLSTSLLGLFAGCTGGGDDASPGGGATSGAATDGGGANYGGDAAAAEDDVGLTAGGAQDVGDFRNNVEEGFLPIPDSLSHEGLFSEYYFDTGGGDEACESLFCAAYSSAVSSDPLAGDAERYFTVGLDSGRSLSEFERPNVNLVVVLDVSGSMDSPFDRYYYDRHGERQEVEGETDRPKIAVARDALVTLTEQLRPGDRLGIVLFESQAETFHRMRAVEETEMDALREDVQSIRAGGGTNIEAGIQRGLSMLEPYEDADRSEYENRIVLLTDAQPNVGDTSSGGLRGTLDAAAEAGQHTTFVGVGLDFNPELVDRITSIRGANYYTVRSAEEFHRRMGEEFAFVVTPLVFDLSVELDGEGAEIVEVYGTSVDEQATASLLSVPTLFPSPREDGETRGGVILVQVSNDLGAGTPELTASWETRAGEQREDRASVTFPAGAGDEYANSGVRKAVLLARYVNLLRNWMIHERDADLVEGEGDIDVPPEDGLGRWEQTSEQLVVTPPYVDRIRDFREHFVAEAEALGDEDLDREVEIVDAILDAAGEGEDGSGEEEDGSGEEEDGSDGEAAGGSDDAAARTAWFGTA